MSEAAPGEPVHGAGEDIPGTPGPFPYGLISVGFAAASIMFAMLWYLSDTTLRVWPLYVFACIGWLVMGVTALIYGQWKGPLLGLVVIVVPWIAISVLMANAFS